MKVKILLFLYFLLIANQGPVFSHGGEHDNKDDPSQHLTPTPTDSIYTIDSETKTESSIISSDPLNSSLSTIDIFGSENLLTGSEVDSRCPMIRFDKKTDSGHQHSQHEKQSQHVEKATYKWISPNSKGHKTAIVITLVSMLVFVILSFLKIGERNTKNIS